MLDFLSLGVLAMVRGGCAEEGTRVGRTSLGMGRVRALGVFWDLENFYGRRGWLFAQFCLRWWEIKGLTITHPFSTRRVSSISSVRVYWTPCL